MPRKRFQNLDPSKQEEILQAAFEEFSVKGFETASLNKIVESAGLSKGALYYYFDDKADLFFEVVKQTTRSMLRSFTELPPAQSAEEFWSSLAKAVDQYTYLCLENPRIMTIIKSTVALINQGMCHPGMTELRKTWFEYMTGVGKTGQALGAIRTDLPFDLLLAVAFGIDHGADFWMAENIENFSSEERKAIGKTIFGLVRRVLEP